MDTTTARPPAAGGEERKQSSRLAGWRGKQVRVALREAACLRSVAMAIEFSCRLDYA
jgi:hypothetical protein